MDSSPISFNSSTSERTAFTAFINSFVGGKSSNNNTSSDSQTKNIGLTSDVQPSQSQKYTPAPNIATTFTTSYSSSPPNPTFSSVISSAPPQTRTPTRLSFQALTNFVPWASRNRPVSTNRSVPYNSPAVNNAPFSNNQGSNNGGKRQYVSREEQLRRLRARMEAEGVERMRSCVHVHCKKCVGEIVLF